MEEILKQLLEGQKKLFEGQKQLFDGQNELIKQMDKMETKQEEQGIILKAVRHAQEIQKAELDQLNISVAHIQGDLTETKEIINNMAGDITFLVRKSAQHEDDIRKLKQVK